MLSVAARLPTPTYGDTRTSQREKVLGELGVMWVTYRLTCCGWDVFRKINERGFDLLAARGGKQLWIEVKSRDPGSSRGENASYVTVGQSAAQRERAQYLAVYVHGPNTCLLLPAALPEIVERPSRNGLQVGQMQGGRFVPVPAFERYVDNFELK